MSTSSPLQRLLASVPLFRDLSPEELASFLAQCQQEEVPAGTAIISQGERGRHLFAVMSGSLSVSRRPEGMEGVEPITLATVKAGEVFGELALVDFGERSASVTATEACRLLRFDRLDVVKLSPLLLSKLYRNVGMLMAARLRQTNSTVTVLLAEKQHEDEAASPPAPDNGFAAPSQRTVIRR
ncbi:cyclic nucleotide-binding domain-containing protein [Chitinimonas sp.]|uniref:cyclic nucleotide-binding domain-containing protein n=1 Tax=Chitinimonas sp. TaxID=1934313 RepID=UPI0035B1B5E4